MNPVTAVGFGVLALALANSVFGASGGYGYGSSLDDKMFRLAYPLTGLAVLVIVIGLVAS
jgi:hypothetical protein